jgi:hypothetical protein
MVRKRLQSFQVVFRTQKWRRVAVLQTALLRKTGSCLTSDLICNNARHEYSPVRLTFPNSKLLQTGDGTRNAQNPLEALALQLLTTHTHIHIQILQQKVQNLMRASDRQPTNRATYQYLLIKYINCAKRDRCNTHPRKVHNPLLVRGAEEVANFCSTCLSCHKGLSKNRRSDAVNPRRHSVLFWGRHICGIFFTWYINFIIRQSLSIKEWSVYSTMFKVKRFKSVI